MKGTERRYSLLYPTLIGLGLGVIASCAQQQPHPPAPPLPLHQVSPPRRVARTRPALLPREKPPPPAGAQGAAPGPSNLLGLDEPAAVQLLGAADKIVERPPAVVWQYEAPDCMLDLYFYLDLKSGQMRTLRYAVEGPKSEAACLATILHRTGASRENAAPPPG